MNGNAEVLTKFTADTSQMDQAEKKMQKSFDNIKEYGKMAFTALTLAADAMVVSLIGNGIEYNKEMETINVRLETLTGSAEDAAKVMEQIKKDATSTPFDVKSLVQAESLLISTGLSSENARDDILALGNAISAVGGGNEELQRMAINMQQIKNVGKASALDIKQFAYAGIDIYGLLADSMGITREEAAKLDVSYEMLSKALQNASKQGGKYYGAMEKQSKTLSGQVDNMKESYQQMTGELTTGFYEALKGVIPLLTSMFNWLTENKNIVIPLGLIVLGLANALTGLFVVSKLIPAFAAMNAVLGATTIKITLIIAVIAALVAGFLYLWNHCEGFRNFFIGLWDTIKTSVQNAGIVIGDIFDWIGDKFQLLSDAFANIKSKIVAHFTNLRDGVNDKIQGIATFFTNIGEGIKNSFKTIINWLIDKFNWFIRQVNKIKFPDWEWLGDLAGKGFNFKELQKLATGTNYVPQDMLAVIHKGEAVVPKKFNPYANDTNFNSIASSGTGNNIIVNIENNMEYDNLGQLVNNIKTFSGGAKNDFNYGMGR